MPAAAAGQTCDLGPSYEAAEYFCSGGAHDGEPCTPPWDLAACSSAGEPWNGACGIAAVGGRATHYDASAGGSCGFGPPLPGELVTAVAEADYQTAALCGRCLQVTGRLGTIKVKVVDVCQAAACGIPGWLDLDDDAFSLVGDETWGTEAVSWTTVPCTTSGDVQLLSSEGSSPYWFGVIVDHHRNGVARLELHDGGSSEWITLPRTAFNRFEHSPSAAMVLPLSVRLTDVVGAVLEGHNVVSSWTGTFDLGAQFPFCDPALFTDGFESAGVAVWSLTSGGSVDGVRCSGDAQCLGGNCECADPMCTLRKCSAAECLCTYDTTGDSVCDGPLNPELDDPEDCETTMTCSGSGACVPG